MTKQEYINNLVRLATESFKDHKIIFEDSDNGRWIIGRPNSSFYKTEIISLYGGRLFVGGDIDDCIFAYFSGPGYEGTPTANYHKAKVKWIGKCEEPSYYPLQKAKIGMTDNGLLTTTYNYEVASEQLLEFANQLREEQSYTIPSASNEMADEIVALANPNVLAECSRDELLDTVYNDMGLYELEHLGTVVSSRVVFAWMACKKLCELL